MTVDRAMFHRLRSSFPTGVTIVTTVDAHGTPKGLTLQAFLFVSSEPPLVLVSLDATSRTLELMREGSGFVVNFLSAGRESLSNLFASKEEHKFASVQWRASDVAKRAPILYADVVAYAECVVSREITAGDHLMFLASVEGGEFIGGRPLMYFRRTYASWPAPDAVTPAPDAWDDYSNW